MNKQKNAIKIEVYKNAKTPLPFPTVATPHTFTCDSWNQMLHVKRQVCDGCRNILSVEAHEASLTDVKCCLH